MRAFITGMSFSSADSRRSDSCVALAGTTWDRDVMIFCSASSLGLVGGMSGTTSVPWSVYYMNKITIDSTTIEAR